MKTFVVLACILVAAQAMSWENFKAKHGKKYSKSEEAKRMSIYAANLEKIQKHNERFQKGEVSYNLAVNKFADLTNEEFTSMLNGHKGKKVKLNKTYKPKGGAPSTVDWRNDGAVTDVKDQGQCGSCWSFSTTGSIEGQYFLKNGDLVSFSEQQLVDCSGEYGNDGCNGGLMDSAFEYIRDNGLETESDYPYTAEDGECAYDSSAVVLSTISSFVDVASGDEDALMDAVANVGPISVAIDASNESFQFYSSGVYDEPDCSSTSLDHGVLAVGYGSENGNDYWLVKNSWGDSWGEDGYIKMSRNSDNQCGIATMASYPEL